MGRLYTNLCRRLETERTALKNWLTEQLFWKLSYFSNEGYEMLILEVQRVMRKQQKTWRKNKPTEKDFINNWHHALKNSLQNVSSLSLVLVSWLFQLWFGIWWIRRTHLTNILSQVAGRREKSDKPSHHYRVTLCRNSIWNALSFIRLRCTNVPRRLHRLHQGGCQQMYRISEVMLTLE